MPCSIQVLIDKSINLQVVAFILISVAVYGRAASLVTNLPIIGGILACGIILILISVLGLVGAVKHHQVVLFFVSFVVAAAVSTEVKLPVMIRLIWAIY